MLAHSWLFDPSKRTLPIGNYARIKVPMIAASANAMDIARAIESKVITGPAKREKARQAAGLHRSRRASYFCCSGF